MAATGTPSRPGPPSVVQRGRLPAAAGARLRAGLLREHRRRPFGPDDVRGAARRALAVAEELGLRGHIARGGLDLGGAELDHVWAVVDAHVVDVTMPVLARDFVAVLRGYVAGDVPREDLTAAAAAWTLEWRVVGDVPAGCRYYGGPILSHMDRASGD